MEASPCWRTGEWCEYCTSALLTEVFFFCSECAAGTNFTTEMTTVGGSVSLKCPRDGKLIGSLLWIRLFSGTFPEFLFGVPTIDSDMIRKGKISSAHRMTAKQMPGEFVLQIGNVQKNDAAVYYCLNMTRHELMFLSGTFLQVKGKVGKTVWFGMKIEYLICSISVHRQLH